MWRWKQERAGILIKLNDTECEMLILIHILLNVEPFDCRIWYVEFILLHWLDEKKGKTKAHIETKKRESMICWTGDESRFTIKCISIEWITILMHRTRTQHTRHMLLRICGNIIGNWTIFLYFNKIPNEKQYRLSSEIVVRMNFLEIEMVHSPFAAIDGVFHQNQSDCDISCVRCTAFTCHGAIKGNQSVTSEWHWFIGETSTLMAVHTHTHMCNEFKYGAKLMRFRFEYRTTNSYHFQIHIHFTQSECCARTL